MNCHLFLFDKILKGSRIVLYGAGSVGNQFYEQIAETNFCEVVLWLDKNADGTLTKKPETIASLSVDDYDIVVIAIENESIANEVKTILMNYGIPENKILHKIHVFSLDSIDWNSGILKDISIKEMQRSDIQKAKTVNKKPIVAMVNSDRGCGKPSETFVR
ncbi:MAG: hypothetical protein LBB56_01655 [Chitinispirillales bacterium]|jgi:FlaA1/EpsC-like NDP-sugar epimerase|nr:hypothetical protein [Chitinispirillales bacterium]